MSPKKVSHSSVVHGFWWVSSRRLDAECIMDFGGRAHVGWMRRSSRGLDGERRAEPAVERRFGLRSRGTGREGDSAP